ncbi:MAG: quinone-dependent dihydroorotate dehydrogenase [Planctomycetota bacterium]|nr:MAG: quinone-dependent dihydroorotate dehydrogenase [Planctomycetota bacterium]
MYGTWLRPLLFTQDPETVHHRAMAGMRLGLGAGPVRALAAQWTACTHPALHVQAFGCHFPGVVGLAAGFDKDGHAIDPLASLGFSHVEVGTVTGQGQSGNPLPRSFRLRFDRALINRMGFNNAGCERMAAYLRQRYDSVGSGPRRPRCPLGINLGKTKAVALDEALDDYRRSVQALAPFADYLVVNVSSPNTPGLRDLQSEAALRPLLRGVRAAVDAVTPGRALLLKIAPDLNDAGIDAAVDVALQEGCQGLICTNTTIARPRLATPWNRVEGIGAGGLSGAPLRHRSTQVLARVARRIDGRVPIIGVGGIESPEHVWEKIAHGASMVQIYTGFVYGGPAIVRRLHRGTLALLRRHKLRHISQAVGRSL